MDFFLSVADLIPVVGTVTRLSQAAVLGIQGKGDEAVSALKSAGLNAAIDVGSVLTLGALRGAVAGTRAAVAGTRAALKVTQATASVAGRSALGVAEREAAQLAVQGAERATASLAERETAELAAQRAARVGAEDVGAVAAESGAKEVEEVAAKAAARKSLGRKALDAFKPNLKVDVPLALAIRGVEELVNPDTEAPDVDDEMTDPKQQQELEAKKEPPLLDTPLHPDERVTDAPLDVTQPQLPHGATPLVQYFNTGAVNVTMGVDLDSLYASVLDCKTPC